MAVEKNTLEFKGNLIQDGMRAGNITLQEGMAALGAIVSKGKALEVEYASLQETDNKAWSYCLIGFVITFFLNCFPLGFIFWYRNHRYVRNRGTYFIFHLISAILLYYISSFLYHGTLTLRYDFLNKSERQRIVISELLSKLHLFFLFACFGAIVCRSRVVYQAFDVQSNTKPSKWIYVSYPVFPLVYLMRKRIHISTERSENKFTRQTSEFGHIVCQQEQENSSTLHMEGNSNSYREKGGKEFTNETDLKIEASIAEMHDL
eukprot:Awhi_evm1s14403